MLDILDAPVPYLVGVHARYLKDVPPSRRPGDVVFVDLDRDEVHLGFEDNSYTLPRTIPAIPSSKVSKLKSKLLDCAASVYVKPDSGKIGTITTGIGREVFDNERDGYIEIHKSECRDHSRQRRDVFPDNDKAYRDNELIVPIAGFQVQSGKFHHNSSPASSSPNRRKMKNVFKKPYRKSTNGKPLSPNGTDSMGSLASFSEKNIFDLQEVRNMIPNITDNTDDSFAVQRIRCW